MKDWNTRSDSMRNEALARAKANAREVGTAANPKPISQLPHGHPAVPLGVPLKPKMVDRSRRKS